MSDAPSAFEAAFCADDSLIEVIPRLDYNGRLPLQSSVTVGPWKAGMRSSVPLWMAMILHKRSLADVVVPEWLAVDSLKKILQHEKSHAALSDQLHAQYFEITQRLLPILQNTQPAVPLLVQDIFTVRVDKLRQQFQELLAAEASSSDVMVQVTGIGSAELALLRPFVVQALNDQRSFFQIKEKEAIEKESTGRPRVSVRRFRSEGE